MAEDSGPVVGATHYDVLGVPRDADRQEVFRAYCAAMRRLHPDVAGPIAPDDDEMFAVQEAWRVLGDDDARSAYDRELDPHDGGWEFDGWGVVVDEPERPRDAERPTGHAPQAPRPTPEAGGSGVDAEPWRTPFAPGAVRIPPLVPPTGPPRRTIGHWLLVTSAAVFAAVSIGVAIATRGVVVEQAGREMSVPVAAAFAALVLLIPIAGVVGVVSAPNADERALPVGLTILFGPVIPALPWLSGTLPAILAASTWAAVILAGLAMHRRAATVRRSVSDAAQALTNVHLAAEWNRLREALREEGARAEESRGPVYLGEPERVRTVDPATQIEQVREVAGGLPRGAWVVVDEDGWPLCTAPPRALEGWLASWPEAAEPARPRRRRRGRRVP